MKAESTQTDGEKVLPAAAAAFRAALGERLPVSAWLDLVTPGDTTSEVIRRLSGVDVHILRVESEAS